MKKILASISLALSLVFFAATVKADVILTADDFDGNTAGNALFANQIGSTITTDPLDATNQVAQIDLEPGGEWGTYHQINNGIDFTALGLAAGDTLNYSWDVLVPTGTTAGAGDTNSLIFRWGDSSAAIPNLGNTAVPQPALSLVGQTPDTWVTVSGSVVIPAANAAGGIAAVTHVNPIWSFRDGGNDDVVGTTLYVDNWTISSPMAVPEPAGLAVLGLLSGMVAIRRRR